MENVDDHCNMPDDRMIWMVHCGVDKPSGLTQCQVSMVFCFDSNATLSNNKVTLMFHENTGHVEVAKDKDKVSKSSRKGYHAMLKVFGVRMGQSTDRPWLVVQNVTNGSGVLAKIAIFNIFNNVPFVQIADGTSTSQLRRQQLNVEFAVSNQAVRVRDKWTAAAKVSIERATSRDHGADIRLSFTFMTSRASPYTVEHKFEADTTDQIYASISPTPGRQPNIIPVSKKRHNRNKNVKHVKYTYQDRKEHNERSLTASKIDKRVDYTGGSNSYPVLDEFVAYNSIDFVARFEAATEKFVYRTACSQCTTSDFLKNMAIQNDLREQSHRVLLWKNRSLNCPYQAFSATLSAHSGQMVPVEFLMDIADKWLLNTENYDKRFGLHIGNAGSILLTVKKHMEYLTDGSYNNQDVCLQAIKSMLDCIEPDQKTSMILLRLRCMVWTILWGKVIKIASMNIEHQLRFYPIESYFCNSNPLFLRHEYMTVFNSGDGWFGECGMNKFLKLWS